MRCLKGVLFFICMFSCMVTHAQNAGDFETVEGSPFFSGNFPYSVAFSPLIDGNLFAAVANSSVSTVSVFNVDPLTGQWTPVAGTPFATGSEPRSVAFSPVANGLLFAAVANYVANSVSVYSVNPATGAFTLVDSPYPTGARPNSVAFSPLINGLLFAVVTNTMDDTVSVYSVNL